MKCKMSKTLYFNNSWKGRHDLCIALRVPVVLEAVTAFVLADLLMLEQRIKKSL